MKKVEKLTSLEQGETATVIRAMSAARNYVPPMFVLPGKRIVDALFNEAPLGSIRYCFSGERNNTSLFMQR